MLRQTCFWTASSNRIWFVFFLGLGSVGSLLTAVIDTELSVSNPLPKEAVATSSMYSQFLLELRSSDYMAKLFLQADLKYELWSVEVS